MKRTDLKADDVKEYIWTHSDNLARILYLYAKLNKAFVYVQGMNEILAVIYYCFWKDNDPDMFDQQQVESDVFMCFSNLMAEVGDGFMISFDSEQGGLFEKCKRIDSILKRADFTVWNKLKELNCDTKFFAIRWVMVLLCQDLEMPDCIRIWDTLLADERRFEFLEYISASIVLRHRTLIIKGDFARVCTCLQDAAKNIADIPILIKEAHQLL